MSEDLRRWAAMVTGDEAARRAAVAAHLKRCPAHTAKALSAGQVMLRLLVYGVLDEDHLPEICL